MLERIVSSKISTAKISTISKNPLFSLVCYLVIIVAVLSWSGRVSEVITLEGIEIRNEAFEQNLRFYTEVLHLPQADSDGKSGKSNRLFSLSDQRQVSLAPASRVEDKNQLTQTLVTQNQLTLNLRVRSGVERLRSKFIARGAKSVPESTTSSDFIEKSPYGSVSPYYISDVKNEFLVKDFSNNILSFSEPLERR